MKRQLFLVFVLATASCGVAEHNSADAQDVVETANVLDEEGLREACGPNVELAEALLDRRDAAGLFDDTDDIDAVAFDVHERSLTTGPSDGLCTWYSWLYDHYASRALQFGMWGNVAMASWYSYWAEYYQGLADEVCEE